jgi:tetratricopeptide (TPR) repeat protein
VIVLYAGRRPSGADGVFPDENEDFVQERLERVFAGLRPRLAVGSAAAGGDLLAAAAAADAGAAVHVVTAGPRDRFRDVSVADKGTHWTALLEGLLQRENVELEELDVEADDDGFAAVNKAVLGRAGAQLRHAERLVLVAVVGERRSGRDLTSDLVDECEAAGHLTIRIDPAVSRGEAPVAFVAMPYGLRKDAFPNRPDYDADATWHRILAPALIHAGYRPVRVDFEPSLEIIDAKMIRSIGQAQLLVADLALHNPNVFWELGVRHAWKPTGTLLVAPNGTAPPPFDVSRVTVYTYQRGNKRVSDADSVAGIRSLRKVISTVSERVDSPVFAALPGLQPQQIVSEPDEDVHGTFTTTLEKISLHADLGRVEELVKLGESLQSEDVAPRGSDALLERIALALLNLKRPDDALRLLRPLADADSSFDRIPLQQQYALALMEASDPPHEADTRLREAERRLIRLDTRHPGSSETLGLLGSVAKRMFRRSTGAIADTHLDQAIDAYVRGFDADPEDYYPGINAIGLLRTRAGRRDSSPDAELARKLLPVVRFMVERPGVPDTVWRRATSAELLLNQHVLEGEPAIDQVVAAYADAARIATPFQVESMRNQLALLQELGDSPETIETILEVVSHSE